MKLARALHAPLVFKVRDAVGLNEGSCGRDGEKGMISSRKCRVKIIRTK